MLKEMVNLIITREIMARTRHMNLGNRVRNL
jgi:hypothetical protein